MAYTIVRLNAVNIDKIDSNKFFQQKYPLSRVKKKLNTTQMNFPFLFEILKESAKYKIENIDRLLVFLMVC